MDPRAEKAALRDAIGERLSRMNDRERLSESRSLCRRLLELVPDAGAVAAYFPLKDEADTRPLLTSLLGRGREVYLPAVEAGKIVYRRIASLEELRPGAYGILEPPPGAPLLQAADIAFVPGRAFDRAGNRLGRGNGGYDVWIRAQRAENPAARFLGVALECQLVHAVPAEAHDEPVDAIVTARGLLQAKRG